MSRPRLAELPQGVMRALNVQLRHPETSARKLARVAGISHPMMLRWRRDARYLAELINRWNRRRVATARLAGISHPMMLQWRRDVLAALIDPQIRPKAHLTGTLRLAVQRHRHWHRDPARTQRRLRRLREMPRDKLEQRMFFWACRHWRGLIAVPPPCGERVTSPEEYTALVMRLYDETGAYPVQLLDQIAEDLGW